MTPKEFLAGISKDVLATKGRNDLIDLFLSHLQNPHEQTILLMIKDEIESQLTASKTHPYTTKKLLVDLIKRWLVNVGISSQRNPYTVPTSYYAGTIHNDLIVTSLMVCGMACSGCGGHGFLHRGFKCKHCNGSRIEPKKPDTSESTEPPF